MHRSVYFFVIWSILVVCLKSTKCHRNQIDVTHKITSIEQLVNRLVNNNTFFDFEDAKLSFQERCSKVSGDSQAYFEVENAFNDLNECFSSIVNITALLAEIRVTLPSGDLDDTFYKYCLQKNVALDCFSNFTYALTPCLEEHERHFQPIVINMTQQLLSFVCYREGNQIALLIAEDGPECVQERWNEISDCVNATIGANGENPDLWNQIPMFELDEQKCNTFSELQSCIRVSLEKCNSPTPSNVVDSLIRWVRKVTPCYKKKIT